MTTKQATEAPERMKRLKEHQAFMTSNSLNGEYYIKIKFPDIQEMHSFHAALIAVMKCDLEQQLATAKHRGINEGLEIAAKMADRRIMVLAGEHGSYDSDTGDETFPDWVETDMEACEALAGVFRALKSGQAE